MSMHSTKTLYPPLSQFSYAPDAPGKPLGCVAGTGRHDTYLHAGAGKGWPHDHKAEDTFDVPTIAIDTQDFNRLVGGPKPPVEERDYQAEFGPDGSARLVLVTATIIATFETFADAQTAAKALNEHKGY